jgi:hypothetical protein
VNSVVERKQSKPRHNSKCEVFKKLVGFDMAAEKLAAYSTNEFFIYHLSQCTTFSSATHPPFFGGAG